MGEIPQLSNIPSFQQKRSMIKIKRTDIILKANPKLVLPLFLKLNKKRYNDLVLKIEALNDETVVKTLNQVYDEFESRHIDFKDILLIHYQIIADIVKIPESISLSRKLLIGAYFTKEYSIESAALFNPSIVVHPNQDGCNSDTIRFVMSLRATGEGHISSVAFRTGLISKNGEIVLDKPSNKLIEGKRSINTIYKKDFIQNRAKFDEKINPVVFDFLPDEFSEQHAYRIIDDIERENRINLKESKEVLEEIFDTNYEVIFDKTTAMSSRVIFPSAKAESMGMEDVRFVKFSENNEYNYIATYTAYNGKNIRVQIIETKDFDSFKISSLHGEAVQGKGMALFPEKINGKFAFIGRQGGTDISIMYSDDLYYWDNYKVIQKPEHEWEMTQLGNSGSPIKTPQGWLLLTHAVGAMRKYVLSATLLDLNNPEKVLATLDQPLLSPNSSEREGYVPNVVYTCGFIQHGENLIIPYAMSDSAISFATVNLQSLLEKLLENKK
jgi:predicted GH43/DUF377 family glycosyl hydrolase